MRVQSLITAAFAAGAAAAPLVERAILTKVDVEVVTLTTTVTGSPEPTDKAKKQEAVQFHAHHRPPPHHIPKAPAPSSSPPAVVVPKPTPTPSPSSTSSAVPTPTPTSAAPSDGGSTPDSGAGDGSPVIGGKSMLSTANLFRRKYGLKEFTWSATLQKNAQKTGTDDQGVNEVHELNPGSNAQVITPGFSVTPPGVNMNGVGPFELSYAAWLCEVKDPELTQGSIDYCKMVDNILHMQYGGTGHHDILTSTQYSKIGCWFAPNPKQKDTSSPYQGLYVCDLTF